jgi:3',5'-cyclic AMP phosphodiesterase CpdA
MLRLFIYFLFGLLIRGDSNSTTTEEIRLIQIADTHIIAGGSCFPAYQDGRTDCKSMLENLEDYEMWVDPITGEPIAPTIALTDSISYINELNPNFVIFTGDLISNGDCQKDSEKSYDLFGEIIQNINTDCYVVGAKVHDSIINPMCRDLYEKTFGRDTLNWYFVMGDNLFVGLSETKYPPGSDKFDLDYFINILSRYQNMNLKLFLFIHTPLRCYDETWGDQYRCQDDVIRNLLNDYKEKYRIIIVLAGHNHANIYDQSDVVNNIHHISTTALMNYPTEFRIIDITPDIIEIYMSQSVNEEINSISLELLGCCSIHDPLTYYGNSSDRNIYIDLSAQGE